MSWDSKIVLVTGSTGSFGKKFLETILQEKNLKKLIVFSRDELKQHEMRIAGYTHSCLRYFIGDIRDLPRLRRAMKNVDIVIHAAAMKQVPACEYNPFEAVKTNVLGTQNVITAAIDAGVEKAIVLSTDKSVEPINLYGATKLVAEKLFVQANAYAGTRFCSIRYGNVVGSRGSVIPVFQKQKANGHITITDERMTRFWLTLEQGVQFVVKCLEEMKGGEVFVPKIPSMRIVDLAAAIAPEATIEITGIRPGEKLNEVLISSNEAYCTFESLPHFYVILPGVSQWPALNRWRINPVPAGFCFTSDTNPDWLTQDDLRRIVETL